jgi:hypothetical protein
LVARIAATEPGIGFCRNINSGETIETIGDITRKNSLVRHATTDEAEQE